MADNSFRSYRSRDPLARDSDPVAREGAAAAADPLAELARLIGQNGLHGEAAFIGRETDAFDDTVPASEVDWAAADDGYAEQNDVAQERYAASRIAESSYEPHPADAASSPHHGGDYEDNPSPAPQRSAQTAPVNTTREDVRDNARVHEVRDRDDQAPAAPRGQRLPFLPPAADDGRAAADSQEYHGTQGESYAADEYYDEEARPVRRRSGIIVIMAVIGLTVVGGAAALGYRAMFGGMRLPSLPPIIKAADIPNKIMPSRAASQAGASLQAEAAGNGSEEKLVPHEEQPVDIPPPNPAPRVVSTIPVFPASPALGLPGAQPPATSEAVPPPSMPTATAPASSPSASGGPAPPAPAPAPAPAAAPLRPSAAAPSGEPKKVHTVAIRPTQLGDAHAAPPRATNTRQRAAKPITESEAQPAPDAPLAIVPQQDEASAPTSHTRTALARPSTAAPMSLAPAVSAPSQGGGYAVQVTSRRSAAEAQASFRALQARFPGQLGNRQPIVRRADLGAKGVYYRALVGPFASAEQAAELCSSLKAAGGSCIVQRN